MAVRVQSQRQLAVVAVRRRREYRSIADPIALAVERVAPAVMRR